ncbi:VIT1/CCC1 transporter family protein [Companilactobacillus sp. HBUAS59544]|uniref:VIT1/CCC1 transporter family protein n=1 Tax=Companilactobacillus sp. HBUAS59544 TaxID=3109363 RepID=UPI002FF3E553
MKQIIISKKKHTHFWDGLNVLRAGILGANDGIISVSGIVLGAAGAQMSSETLFLSGVAGMIAGACSMAGGEYISVSTQKDVQENKIRFQEKSNQIDATASKTIIKSIDILNPIHAAISSFFSFFLGSIIPLMAITCSPANWRIVNTIIAMIIALFLNGQISASNSEIPARKVVVRNIVVGIITALLTYIIGSLLSV